MNTSRIFIPCDAAALSVGAESVARAIADEAARRGLAVEIVRTGSRGMLWLEPLVEVVTDRGRVGYANVRPSEAAAVLDGGLPNDRCIGVVDDHPWLASQQRVSFARVGVVDPLASGDGTSVWVRSRAGSAGEDRNALPPWIMALRCLDAGARGAVDLKATTDPVYCFIPAGRRWARMSRSIPLRQARHRATSDVAPASAWAQRRAEAPRESVELVIAADGPQGSAAEAVARDLLTQVPVSLDVRRAPRVEPEVIVAPRTEPPRDGPIAHVWLDLTQRDTATLYLVDRRWERVLVRHFDRVGRAQAVVHEALCHALVTAIEALLAGGVVLTVDRGGLLGLEAELAGGLVEVGHLVGLVQDQDGPCGRRNELQYRAVLAAPAGEPQW